MNTFGVNSSRELLDRFVPKVDVGHYEIVTDNYILSINSKIGSYSLSIEPRKPSSDFVANEFITVDDIYEITNFFKVGEFAFNLMDSSYEICRSITFVGTDSDLRPEDHILEQNGVIYEYH